MSSRSLVLGGAAVVVLSGVAAWIGATLAQPPRDDEPAGAAADLRSHLDENDRRLDAAERRLDAVETVAQDAKSLAEAVRDRRDAAPAAAPGAPAAGAGGPAGAPATTRPGGAAGGSPDAAPAPEPTDEERREAHRRQIMEAVRSDARIGVPALLRQFADTSDAAVAARLREARVTAQQTGLVLALDGAQANRLRDVYTAHAERIAGAVAPLVRDGIERNAAAIAARLEESWRDVDRDVRDAIGETSWPQYEQHAAAARALIRQVLAEHAAAAPPR